MISSIKKSMKIVSVSGISLLGSLSTAICKADDFFTGTDANPGGGVIKVAKGDSLGKNITDLINYFLGFLGLVAVAFIIYGGVLMVTSAGEEEGVGKAKKIITYAAIGIVIILLSYTIVSFVTSSLGNA